MGRYMQHSTFGSNLKLLLKMPHVLSSRLLIKLTLPTTRFEPRTFGVGSDHFTKCGHTTTAN